MTATRPNSSTPSGPAGGDLTGTYPNPTIANAVKDPAAGTAGLRTLGTGSQQAAAGNDSRLTNSRTPSGSAGGDLTGTYPNPTLAPGILPFVNVASYGAAGDAKYSRSVTTANGSPIIHDTTTSPWTSGDVGKKIMGAGIPANTTILSYQSATQVTLSANCTATVTLGGNDSVSGARVVWYTQDDTTAVTSAINSISAQGGTLYFPGSGYVVHGLVWKALHYWQGAGEGATTLWLTPGSTDNVVTGENFASLTGTGSLRGVYSCGIADMTIDGNRDLNTSGGYCLCVYGSNYKLRNVELRFGHAGNWYSEFGLSDDASNNRRGGMEAQIVNVKSHSSDNDGINWRGPHDSTWVNVQTFLHGGMGLHTETNANYNGGGLVATNFAAWACGTYSMKLETDLCHFYAFHSELASVASVFTSGNAVTLMGEIYPGATVAGKGLVMGDGTNNPSGNRIDVHITGYTTGSTLALDLTNSGGGNMIRAVINAASGQPYTLGSNQAIDSMWINCTGGAGPSVFQILANTNPKLKGRVELDNFGGTGTGAVNLDMQGLDTLRQTLQMYNSSTSGDGYWYMDHRGSASSGVTPPEALGFRSGHTGSNSGISGYSLALTKEGWVQMFNGGSAPSSSPASSVYLYGASGALKAVNNAGTVVTLVPAAAAPTVTGSRGGNAALASLLTTLASAGIITDGTSA